MLIWKLKAAMRLECVQVSGGGGDFTYAAKIQRVRTAWNGCVPGSADTIVVLAHFHFQSLQWFSRASYACF